MNSYIKRITVVGLISLGFLATAHAKPEGWTPPAPKSYSATVLSSVSLPGGSPSTFVITRGTFNACNEAVSQFLVADPLGNVVSSCSLD